MPHMSVAGLEKYIDTTCPVTRIVSGFLFLEGPVWNPLDKILVFSDIVGNTTWIWDPASGVRIFRRPSFHANGLTFDHDLNLIVCEHSKSMLVRIHPDGCREVLASHFEGKELNSPNDVCVHRSGAIYFTDPDYGRTDEYGIERPLELGFQGVYRLAPGSAAPQLLVDRNMFDQPNGLCFSPDETSLYVNDTDQAVIRQFDVRPDGGLENPRLFASGIKSEMEVGAPDGMKCDIDGNVWCTGPGGVWVFDSGGSLKGKLATPEPITNLHWGGDGWSTLYLSGLTALYCLNTYTRGRLEPFMVQQSG